MGGASQAKIGPETKESSRPYIHTCRDWGPCIPNIGIDHARLIAVPAAFVQNVKVVSRVGIGSAGIEVSIYGHHEKSLLDVDAHIKITSPGGAVVLQQTFPAVGLPLAPLHSGLGTFEMRLFASIQQPELWFVVFMFPFFGFSLFVFT